MPQKYIHIVFILFALLFVIACGSAPTATVEPTASLNSGEPTSVIATPVSSIASPPLSNAEPSGLKVAFVLNGNVWLWSETTPARQLTADGDAAQIKISEDGKVIVYQRGQTLWAVNNDGSNPRQLVDVPAFTGRPFLTQFEFQPNTHVIYFNSRESVQASVGVDLQRVDADSPAPQTVLQQGGQFTFSPDGRLLTLADVTRINVLRTDSSALVSALDFPKVDTQSDWSYYPQVVWLDNSSGFYTVIPGSGGQKSRFLYVAADGSFTAQLAEFAAADVRVSKPVIAPNGSKVAYISVTKDSFDVHVIDASTADAIIATHPTSPQFGLWSWSPDSTHFTYWATNPALLLVAGINIPPVPVVDSLTAYSLTWVDANRFLYITTNDELQLGAVGNPNLAVTATGFTFGQDARSYDFAP